MRHIHYHLGFDAQGDCCRRMCSAAEARRSNERQRLQPKIAWLVACGTGRELWRNGMHRRRWAILVAQVRADRRCFLTTLKRPPLISPNPPF